MKLGNLIIAACLAFSVSNAYALSGKVVRVLDGDTLIILTKDKEQVRIRLKEIDAPEKKQAFGKKSKNALIQMCAGKNAEIRVPELDRYKRTLGHVYCDGLYVNKELVKLGLAWVYRRYSKDPSMIVEETKSKTAKRGLWADSNPTPPWEYRRR